MNSSQKCVELWTTGPGDDGSGEEPYTWSFWSYRAGPVWSQGGPVLPQLGKKIVQTVICSIKKVYIFEHLEKNPRYSLSYFLNKYTILYRGQG